MFMRMTVMALLDLLQTDPYCYFFYFKLLYDVRLGTFVWFDKLGVSRHNAV